MTRGLNGETVYQRENVYVGTVPGESYGYKRNLRVTVSVRMEHLDRQEQYETTEHQLVRKPLEFSITTDVWRPDGRDIVSGGATVEPLTELTGFAPGFSAAQARELVAAAEWHLNATTAGCAHQKVVYEEGRYGRQASLGKTPRCRTTAAMALHPDVPATDDTAATEGGYRYGSAWLVRELPPGFMERVKHALPPEGGRYVEPAGGTPTLRQRMQADGIRAEIRGAGRSAKDGGRAWSVKFLRDGAPPLRITWHAGEAIRKAPSADEVLDRLIDEAMAWESAGGWPGWAREYGYREHDKAARKIHDAVGLQTRSLRSFLGAEYGPYLHDTER
jgi:hypothetical protein